MDYRLKLLDSAKFENLVVAICSKILGIGMISFAPVKTVAEMVNLRELQPLSRQHQNHGKERSLYNPNILLMEQHLAQTVALRD